MGTKKSKGRYKSKYELGLLELEAFVGADGRLAKGFIDEVAKKHGYKAQNFKRIWFDRRRREKLRAEAQGLPSAGQEFLVDAQDRVRSALSEALRQSLLWLEWHNALPIEDKDWAKHCRALSGLQSVTNSLGLNLAVPGGGQRKRKSMERSAHAVKQGPEPQGVPASQGGVSSGMRARAERDAHEQPRYVD